jgi:hypothetical protein
MVAEYKDAGLITFILLGNEIIMAFWDGETENIPLEDRKSTIRAEALYKLLMRQL